MKNSRSAPGSDSPEAPKLVLKPWAMFVMWSLPGLVLVNLLPFFPVWWRISWVFAVVVFPLTMGVVALKYPRLILRPAPERNLTNCPLCECLVDQRKVDNAEPCPICSRPMKLESPDDRLKPPEKSSEDDG